MVVGLLAVGLAAAIANTYAPKSTADLFEKVSKEVQQLLQSTVEHKAIEHPPPKSRRYMVLALLGVGAYVILRKVYRRRKATRIEGATIVITGGSQGIGAALAKHMADRGAKTVVVVARTKSKLEKVCNDINESHPRTAHFFVADTSNGTQVDALAKALRGKTPDIVVNCAGAGAFEFLPDMSAANVRRCFDAPTLSALLVTRALLPGMVMRKSGVVVNIQSPAAYSAWGGATAYVSARWGLRGFTRALSADLWGTGVAVQEVVLPYTDSQYFTTHKGSAQRIPWVGKLIGRKSVHDAASCIIRGIESGEDVSVYGMRLYLTMILNSWWPSAVDVIMHYTGWYVAKDWSPADASKA